MTTPTGWYPDPADPSRERWFDAGTGTWLEHSRPRATSGFGAAGPPPPPKPRRGLYVVIGVIAAVLLIGGISSVVSGGDDAGDRGSATTTPESAPAAVAASSTDALIACRDSVVSELGGALATPKFISDREVETVDGWIVFGYYEPVGESGRQSYRCEVQRQGSTAAVTKVTVR